MDAGGRATQDAQAEGWGGGEYYTIATLSTPARTLPHQGGGF